MAWIDAGVYFSRFEEEPLVMSREEAVLLALIDPVERLGFCCCCGHDISHKARQARWCDTCHAIKRSIQRVATTQRWRDGLRRQNRCKCGKLFTVRSGPEKRCPRCQKEYASEYDRDRMRRRRAEAGRAA
jgi:hypothetical protein